MPTLLQSSRFLALIGLQPVDALHRASAFFKKCYSINYFCRNVSAALNDNLGNSCF